jgi:Domain of unknown function (DUF4282)
MSTDPAGTQRGFFRDLFDFSFTRLVTPRVVKVLYAITLVFLVIVYVVIAVAIFSGGGGTDYEVVGGRIVSRDSGGNAGLGVLWLLLIGPLLLFLYTLLYRVFFEILVVLFRIYENTRDQLAVTRAQGGGGTPPVTPPPAAP